MKLEKQQRDPEPFYKSRFQKWVLWFIGV